MITIINYGAGNLASVAKAIVKLGYEPRVTSDPKEVLKGRVVILPGVGAAGDAMQRLESLGMVEPILKVAASDRPFLGICLGLQLLLTVSEESGGQRCLDLVPGVVRKLPPTVKVPHMGWNQVNQKGTHPLFQGIPDGADFYFVHSYFAEPVDKSLVYGETSYGLPFCSVLARGNMAATQFHPEKSNSVGLRLLQNFLELAHRRPQSTSL